jgi:hypothetical protein
MRYIERDSRGSSLPASSWAGSLPSRMILENRNWEREKIGNGLVPRAAEDSLNTLEMLKLVSKFSSVTSSSFLLV